MDRVYINMKEENDWIKKYFKKDLVSVEDLLSCIEDLDSEIYELKEKLREKEEPTQWDLDFERGFKGSSEY